MSSSRYDARVVDIDLLQNVELLAQLSDEEMVTVAASAQTRRYLRGDVVFDDTWGGTAPWAADPPDTRFTRAGPPREA